ncbi:MAG TPA: hypothetical protein VE377_09055 [Candidatus Dormibacteraeota bacterium]|nr:hypothetical protein [Candidatus Dormibacteraeota bacterium]
MKRTSTLLVAALILCGATISCGPSKATLQRQAEEKAEKQRQDIACSGKPHDLCVEVFLECGRAFRKSDDKVRSLCLTNRLQIREGEEAELQEGPPFSERRKALDACESKYPLYVSAEQNAANEACANAVLTGPIGKAYDDYRREKEKAALANEAATGVRRPWSTDCPANVHHYRDEYGTEVCGGLIADDDPRPKQGPKEEQDQAQQENGEAIAYIDFYVKANTSLQIGKRYRFVADVGSQPLCLHPTGYLEQATFDTQHILCGVVPAFDDPAEYEPLLRAGTFHEAAVVASMGADGNVRIHKVHRYR